MRRHGSRLVGLSVALFSLRPAAVQGACLFAADSAAPPAGHAAVAAAATADAAGAELRRRAYVGELVTVDFAELRADVVDMFGDSREAWPADYGDYAPLFVRLAWHNTGSYRASDGRGGADGLRQRFDPERSWDDNTNLDKARSLLWAVKERWPKVSWGDLVVFAGGAAIEHMGGPTLGFCGGRIDDDDGANSELLGPTAAQAAFAPCEQPGNCTAPLGASVIGLIYVNPEGPFGVPDPVASAVDVRDTFARMTMDDWETVALIGGGHAFGKTHGACPAGAGPPPSEQPRAPWPGLCGSGVGEDAFTSGFEGAWTTRPTTWDNEYFRNLQSVDWEPFKGPGGRYQWRAANTSSQPFAPTAAGGGRQATLMLTSDVALVRDTRYAKIVSAFADDAKLLAAKFATTWYKLMSRDMGPWARCAEGLTMETPPPQPFQFPLPAPASPPDFGAVKAALADGLAKRGDAGTPAALVRLAWSCASTFRETDYRGGCNGAYVRLAPQRDWPSNAGLSETLEWLAPFQNAFAGLSWADLIVLAGNVGLEAASAHRLSVPFCGGRSDAAEDGGASVNLEPSLAGLEGETPADLSEAVSRSGLSRRDWVAVFGARRSLERFAAPFYGNATADPDALDNAYFLQLFRRDWVPFRAPGTLANEFKAADADVYALSTDLNLRFDSEFSQLAMAYAADESLFLRDVATAWTKLMNADRFGACAPA